MECESTANCQTFTTKKSTRTLFFSKSTVYFTLPDVLVSKPGFHGKMGHRNDQRILCPTWCKAGWHQLTRSFLCLSCIRPCYLNRHETYFLWTCIPVMGQLQIFSVTSADHGDIRFYLHPVSATVIFYCRSELLAINS